MRVLGILMIVVGFIAIASGGITYTKREKLIDTDPIKVSIDEKKHIPVSPIAGAAALVTGVILVSVPRRQRMAEARHGCRASHDHGGWRGSTRDPPWHERTPCRGRGVAAAIRAVVFRQSGRAERPRRPAARSTRPSSRRGGAYRVVETAADGDFAAAVDRELKHAADAGCDLVIAAGGGGTVSMVAERLHRLGRGGEGHGARDRADRYGEHPGPGARDPVRARGVAVALAAARPQVRWIDGLTVGDRLVLTQVGIGLDALMIRAHEPRGAAALQAPVVPGRARAPGQLDTVRGCFASASTAGR